VTFHNGTLLGSRIDPVVNAMPNRQPPRSSALLGLPRAPNALLLQHTGVGKLSMVGLTKLSWTSGFVPMTLNAV
jgi:hypothetical protein